MSKFKNIWLVLPVVAGVAAVGYGAWIYMSKPSGSEESYQMVEAGFDTGEALSEWAQNGDVTAVEPAADQFSNQSANLPLEGPSSAAVVEIKDFEVVVDGVDPKAVRSIGRVDAPVTINDFSSLTCPHCANAHANILPRLIEDYVKTGKVRIVFNDFPLNQAALDGSKISRCVANDQYLGFMSMLFSSIEQWAYSNNPSESLVNNAVLTGLSPERARECLNDEDLEKAILMGLQEGAQTYKVNSTPTFVVNHGAHVIRGAQAYGIFQRAIEAELEKANASSQ